MTDLAAMLAKLRKIESEAKKGPWKGAEIRHGLTSGWMYCDMGDAIWVSDADSAFIAASRNVMGLLLDVVTAAATYTDNLGQQHYWKCPVHVGGDPRDCDCGGESLWRALSRLAAAKVGP